MSKQHSYRGLHLLFIFISINCCNSSRSSLDCDTVNYLLERDQYYRQKHEDLLSPQFYLWDSLLKDYGIEKGIDGMSSIDPDIRNKFRKEAIQIYESRPKPDQHVLDSIWQLQGDLDYQNTQLLIDIVNRTDPAAIDTMTFECSRKSFIVFVHTPDELKEEVKKTIDRIKLEQIDPNQYRHIMWQLNGRPPQ